MNDPNLGLIFHMGPYSFPGYDDVASARRRKLQNGSEWYLKRLIEPGTYRPVTGWKETQTFHNTQYPGHKYDEFAQQLTATGFETQVDTWMQLAQEVRASYVIFTSKHHDGYCMWPTLSTSKRVPGDFVGPFITAARKYGLKCGIYYSWMEFEQSFTKTFINTIVNPQIQELSTLYNPDIWWFDGDWEVHSKVGRNFVYQTCDALKKRNPLVQINDRVCTTPDKSFAGTYYNFSDRFIPTTKPNVVWEHINTIGLSWGLNRFQAMEPDVYKTGTQLLTLYNTVHSLGGRLLLNLGPDYIGNLDPYEVTALRDFGQQRAKTYTFNI